MYVGQDVFRSPRFLRDGGRDIHSLQSAIGIAPKPQVPSREDAIVLPSPELLDRKLTFGRLLIVIRIHGFQQHPGPVEDLIGELEVARNHLRVSQPVRSFCEISVGALFFGSCNQLGGYCLRFANVGTELLHEKYLEQ